MKKIYLVFILVMAIAGLNACGRENYKDNIDTQKEITGTKNGNKVQKKDLQNDFKGIYEVGTPKFFINVPKDYTPIEIGFTQLFDYGGERSIAVTAVGRSTEPSSLQEAYNKALENFIRACHFEDYVEITSLSIENEETLEINGIDLFRFEGKLNCTDDLGDYELYTVGYSFIMDKKPCIVIGTVLEREQPQDMVDEIRTYVDYMITTLRNER